jgi:hypothetical protein
MCRLNSENVPTFGGSSCPKVFKKCRKVKRKQNQKERGCKDRIQERRRLLT